MESSISHLAKQLKNGDPSAFDRIFHAYHPKVLQFCLKYGFTRQDAEEVVQEAFVKLWIGRDKIDPEKEVAPFLFKIAKNLIFDTFKKRVRETAAAKYQMTLNVPVNDVEETLNYRELASQLKLALEKLPEKRRAVFEMARIKGLTYKEISIELGISPKTVENHMTLAIQDFEKSFQKSYPLLVILCLVGVI